MTYRSHSSKVAWAKMRNVESADRLELKLRDQSNVLLALYRENDMLRRKAKAWKELARAFYRGFVALGGKPSSP